MTDDTRRAIARDAGIPALADRLRGDTASELEADARRLAAQLGISTKTTVADAQARYRKQREARGNRDPFAGMKVVR